MTITISYNFSQNPERFTIRRVKRGLVIISRQLLNHWLVNSKMSSTALSKTKMFSPNSSVARESVAIRVEFASQFQRRARRVAEFFAKFESER